MLYIVYMFMYIYLMQVYIQRKDSILNLDNLNQIQIVITLSNDLFGAKSINFKYKSYEVL